MNDVNKLYRLKIEFQKLVMYFRTETFIKLQNIEKM